MYFEVILFHFEVAQARVRCVLVFTAVYLNSKILICVLYSCALARRFSSSLWGSADCARPSVREYTCLLNPASHSDIKMNLENLDDRVASFNLVKLSFSWHYQCKSGMTPVLLYLKNCTVHILHILWENSFCPCSKMPLEIRRIRRDYDSQFRPSG